MFKNAAILSNGSSEMLNTLVRNTGLDAILDATISIDARRIFKPSPEAYERLLLDAMSGDATLFARRDEVEEAWAFIDPIEEAWHAKRDAPPLCFYPAGSWGPEEADELLARDGRTWRRL